MAEILFHAHLEPDINLIGFNLTPAQVRNEPWWFIIAEHPTAPRLGLEESRKPSDVLNRDTLAWSVSDSQSPGNIPDLPMRLGFLDALRTTSVADPSGGTSITWGRDAASCAHALLRDPFRAAWLGRTLIKGTR